MEYKISDLISKSQGILKLEKGSDSLKVSKLDSVVFASNPEALKFTKATLLITSEKLAKSLNIELSSDQVLISAPSIQIAMSLVLPLFDNKVGRHEKGVSQKASVHPSAKIAKSATICDFAVVEKDAVIGEHTVIHSFAYIGALCEIGNNCEIHPHTTIGSDGYGYYQDKENKSHKIAQVGKVVIEDNVEIGANCAIDRATILETRIGTGTKLDNLVHIAHNCKVGKNCLLTAGFMMAGSSEIGDNFMCGGNTLVTDHVKITNNVIVAGRSAVTNDVTESGQYGGYPLQPIKDSLKSLASFAKLPEMRKQLAEVRKKLGMQD